MNKYLEKIASLLSGKRLVKKVSIGYHGKGVVSAKDTKFRTQDGTHVGNAMQAIEDNLVPVNTKYRIQHGNAIGFLRSKTKKVWQPNIINSDTSMGAYDKVRMTRGRIYEKGNK